MDKLALTVKETSETLSVSTKTVRALIDSGRLPAIRVGEGKERAKWLVPKDSIHSFLQGQVA